MIPFLKHKSSMLSAINHVLKYSLSMVVFGTAIFMVASAQQTIPSTPTLLSPVNGEIDVWITKSFDWTNSAWATRYRIQISTDSGFNATFADTTIAGNSIMIAPFVLNVGTTYNWRINAGNAHGDSPWSAVWRFTTRSYPLQLQSPLKYETDVSLSPELKWETVYQATTYRVQVSTDSNFTSKAVNDSTVTAASEIVGPLSPNTVYYWRVSYKNNGPWSPWSETWAFYTTAATMAEFRNLPSFDPKLFCSKNAIRYILAAPSNVSIKVYDLRGKVVWHVEKTSQNAGIYCLNPNSDEIGSGQYILIFRAGAYMTTRKIGAIY